MKDISKNILFAFMVFIIGIDLIAAPINPPPPPTGPTPPYGVPIDDNILIVLIVIFIYTFYKLHYVKKKLTNNTTDINKKIPKLD